MTAKHITTDKPSFSIQADQMFGDCPEIIRDDADIST